LPQLLNVLIGDMSFVGPRPLMKVDYNAYDDYFKERIYLSRPGITGIGSVIFRDEQKLISASSKSPKEFYKDHILPAKGALDIWYQKNKGISTDFKILFVTMWAIIFPHTKLPYKIFSTLPKVHDSLYELDNK